MHEGVLMRKDDAKVKEPRYVVNAKVAVLRFWSERSGSMSQLQRATTAGRDCARRFKVRIATA